LLNGGQAGSLQLVSHVKVLSLNQAGIVAPQEDVSNLGHSGQ
jgi:hypothetical protein